MRRLQQLVAELRRRRIFRALLGWGIVSFAVLQVAEPVMHALDLKDWVLKVVVAVLAAGFPMSALLSWFFDLGPGGVTRTPELAPEPAGASPSQRRGALAGLVIVSALGGAGLAFVALRTLDRPAEVAPSVAVLPFADMSATRDQEYFADGIAEEILNALAQVEGLKVAGRTSSFAFKRKNEDLATIAQKLRVGTLLEGSVRKDGNRVRVTAQLINAGDGYHLWSQTFERELTGLFAVQDEIARAVVAALKVRVLPRGETASTAQARPTTAPEAYAKYLLGRHFIALANREGMNQAVKALDECVALDPRFAPAWASLSYALYWAVQFEGSPAEAAEYTARAIRAADRAVELAPALPDGYAMRGFLRSGPPRWDWRGAEADMDRALSLGLADASLVRLNARWITAAQGRLGEAVAILQRIVEQDPLAASTWVSLAVLLAYQDRDGEAVAAVRRGLEIAPGNPIAQSILCNALVWQGRAAEALEVSRTIKVQGWRLFAEARALAALGDRAGADRAVAELEAKEGDGMAFQIAAVHAFRGDGDRAFPWLDRALAQKDQGLAELLVARSFRPLRGDPRFRAMLVRMNLPADAVAR